jgi:hypothetical protein
VKFDKLHPAVANQKEVPFIGNFISCRWSFEAMAVQQHVDNPINSKLLSHKIDKYQSSWKRDYWIPEMKGLIAEIQNPEKSKVQKENAKRILLNEIKKEEAIWTNFECENCVENIISKNNYLSANYFLLKLQQQYIKQFEVAVKEIEKEMKATGYSNFKIMEYQNINENLGNLLTNREEFNKILRYDGELVQKVDQIFQDSPSNGIFSSPLYVPYKYLFGFKVPTFWMNMMVLWLMSFCFYFVLYYDLLSKLMGLFKIIGFQKSRLT